MWTKISGMARGLESRKESRRWHSYHWSIFPRFDIARYRPGDLLDVHSRGQREFSIPGILDESQLHFFSLDHEK